jgi:hypothetical protein
VFTEDLDVFLADFGVASTLQGGSAGAVMAIYDAAYLEQLGIAGTHPQALVKASAVAAADINKTLTRTDTGAVHTIKGREPVDDGAFVVLTLKA